MSPWPATALGPYLDDDRVVGRFWRFADRSAEPGCWRWTGARSSNGYPRLYVAQVDGVAQTVGAHRSEHEEEATKQAQGKRGTRSQRSSRAR